MAKYKNKYRIESHRKPNWDYSADALYFLTIVTQNRVCNLGKIVNSEMNLSDFGKIVESEWFKSFEIRNELILHDFIMMPNHLHTIVEINNDNRFLGFDESEMMADGGMAADRIADGGMAADGMADGGMAADGMADGGMAADGMADGGMAADGMADGGMAADGMADGGMAADGMADGGMAADGMAVQTHGRVSLPAIPIESIPPIESIAPGILSIKRNPPIRLPKSISSFMAGFKSSVNTKIDDYIDENKLSIPKYNRKNHFFQSNYHDHIIRNYVEYQNISNYIKNNPSKWGKDKFRGK